MTADEPGTLRLRVEPPAGPPPELLYKHRASLIRGIQEVWEAREILRSLVERQLRARYKQSFLGFAWALATPVALMIAFGYLFDKVTQVATDGVPYALFSYLGLLPWTFFSGSCSAAVPSLVAQLSLINKVFCPRQVFALAGFVVAMLDMVLASVVLIVLFVINDVTPGAQALWTPLLVLIILTFTAGVSLGLAIATVYLRDIRNALPLVLQLGLFATPVAYAFTTVPERWRDLYSLVNPLGPAIDGLRHALLTNEVPNLRYTSIGAVGAVLALGLGTYAFKRLETGIADVA